MAGLAWAIALSISSAPVHAFETTIKVEGFRSSEGYLAMSVFAEKEAAAFPSDASKAERTFYIPLAGKKEVSVPFADLAPGKYAIAVMHDQDSNHKMTFNFLGMPKKGFGFSNNPRVYFSAPSFTKAAIPLGPDQKAQSIILKHYN